MKLHSQLLLLLIVVSECEQNLTERLQEDVSSTTLIKEDTTGVVSSTALTSEDTTEVVGSTTLTTEDTSGAVNSTTLTTEDTSGAVSSTTLITDDTNGAVSSTTLTTEDTSGAVSSTTPTTEDTSGVVSSTTETIEDTIEDASSDIENTTTEEAQESDLDEQRNCTAIFSQLENVTITATTSTIEISWDPHEYAAACNVRYEVDATTEMPYFRYANKTNYVVKTLKSCTDYNISVTPLRMHGKEFEDKMPKFLYTVGTLPEKVTNGNLKYLDGTARISWRAPYLNKCIKEYKITKSNENHTNTVLTTRNTVITINNSSYCDYVKIEAITNHNQSSEALTLLKPGPVADLKVANKTDTSLTISWSSENDSCVVSYLVQLNKYPQETVSRNRCSSDGECYHAFESLTSCTAYTVRVRSVSEVGTFGEDTLIQTSTLPPLQIVSVENLMSQIDGDVVGLSWDSPLNAKSCNITYIIQVHNNKSRVYHRRTSETYHQIEHVNWIGCISYTVGIEATTNESKGEVAEKEIEFRKAPDPPLCSLEEVGKTSVVLNCTAEHQQVNMCAASEIVVECEAPISTNSDSWVKNATISRMIEDANVPLVIEIENLSEFTNYSCRAILSNEEGNSSASSIEEFQTNENVPGAPTFDAIRSSDRSFTITWTPPHARGILRSYAIAISALEPLYPTPEDCGINKNLTKVYNVTAKPPNQFVFLEAQPSYGYEVSIKAFTGAGYGPEKTNFVQTLAAPPEEPREVNFSVNVLDLLNYNVTVDIVWKYPCLTNGDIKHFEVELVGLPYADLDIGTHVATYEIPLNASIDFHYQHSIPNLKPAFNYTVYIKVIPVEAVNASQTSITFRSPETYPEALNLQPITEVTKNAITLGWSEPSRKNGELTRYYVEVITEGALYFIPDDKMCLTKNENYSFDIPPAQTSFTFTQGSPYYSYIILLRASTEVGDGPVSQIKAQTSESEPEAVRELNVDIRDFKAETYNVSAMVEFKYPCNTNGALNNITAELSGERSNYVPDLKVEHLDRNESYLLQFYDLKPSYSYVLTVKVNLDNYSNSSTFKFSTPAGVPSTTSNISSPELYNSTFAAYTLRKDLFPEHYGEILYYAFIVGVLNHEEKSTFGFWAGDEETWPKIERGSLENSWERAYQATPNFWNPFKESTATEYRFVVGDPSFSEFNKPLRPGVTYTLKVRGFTQDGYRDTPTVTFEIPEEANVPLILGLIFGLLGTGAAMGFFLYVRHKKKQQWEEKKESIKAVSSSPCPIPIKEFSVHYIELANNNEKIKQEFALLNTLSSETALPALDGLLPENKKKNRYTNIIPYDITRVKLQNVNDGYSNTDYINASYVKGYSDRIEYIATQGPLEHTCIDFWKMVMQENSSLIVMVAQFVEQNKNKCHKYFPNNHENMELENGTCIRCCTELNFKTHIVRTLLVQKDLQQWTVTHLQFTEWPDFGCPTGTEVILEFCRLMREHGERNMDPIVVHCSAGVGRTGTLIALDILLQAINAGQDIDIFNTVLNLRKDRLNMVQTEKQYLFINNCINDAIESHTTTQPDIWKEPIYENVEEVKNGYVNMEESRF